MEVPWWVITGLAISLLGLVPMIVMWLDRFRKKNPDLVDRAMKMVELADKQADEMREELTKANTTIKNLNYELMTANNQIVQLNRELTDARAEVSFLQTQVKLMTLKVERENNG